MKIKIGSFFSGVGGLEKELLNENYKLVYVAEPDKYCKAVLEYLHPNIVNFDTVTSINPEDLPDVDIMMAGTSCQNFSYQGDRKGLDGDKSKLFYDYIRIIKAKQPKYVVWENVAGALTANKQKDFEIVKQLFNEAGYEIDYDLFDASKYSSTIQQRRRIILFATRKDIDQIRLDRTIPSVELDEEMQGIKGRLVSISKSHREKHVDFRINKGVANTLVTGWGCSGMSTKNYMMEDGMLRDLNINECEALMTWPKDMTKYGIINGKTIEIPLNKRYKMCGNGVVSKMMVNLLTNLTNLKN